MGSLTGLLITVRTGRQGAAMEKGKLSPEYEQEISILTINGEDFAALDLAEDQRAVLKSSGGEVLVTCRVGDGPQGLFFLPLGPVANRLIDEETHGTGVPDFKGIPVEVRPDYSKVEGKN
ncbi:MAG: molybdopterin dinucleotide binding domain-containing protein [Dehalobacterium sp.]